jgi:hypothetical protein
LATTAYNCWQIFRSVDSVPGSLYSCFLAFRVRICSTVRCGSIGDGKRW